MSDKNLHVSSLYFFWNSILLCYKWRSQHVYELMGLKSITWTILIPLWDLWNICWCIITLGANNTLDNLFGSSRWAVNLATSKKSEPQGQKFIQVFPGNKKTWINCEGSNSSESAARSTFPSELPKKLCCVSLLRAVTGYVTWAD